MKKILYSILAFTLSIATLQAQFDHKFRIGVSSGLSITGSSEYCETYRRSQNSHSIDIISTSTSRNWNSNFNIGYQLPNLILINGSIGVASYGFGYTGDVIASPTNFISIGGFKSIEDYRTRLMEVGLSVAYQQSIADDMILIIQPGAAWYTNPRDPRSQILEVNQKSDNFSATFFAGIEVPISSNSFYASFGLSTKIPLGNFGSSNNEYNKFYPYSLGIQTSISYRLWRY